MASPRKIQKIDDSVPSTSKGIPKQAPEIKLSRNEKSLQQLIDDIKYFDKDGLVHTLHGITYQMKLILRIMIQAANKNYKFRMASERKGAGKFDDIEIQYIDSQGNLKKYLIQVKHSQDDSKAITKPNLMNESDGAYSISKYFISYREIKKKLEKSEQFNLVIFTNLDFKAQLQDDFDKADTDEILDISNKRGKCVKFNANSSLKKQFIETLKNASDFHLLIKNLVHCINKRNKIDFGNQLFKKYSIILSRHVFDFTTEKTVIKLDEDNLPSDFCKDLKDYDGEKIEVSESFRDLNPKLSTDDLLALQTTISQATSKNNINLNKIPSQNIAKSDSSKKPKIEYVDVAKFAGHVFVKLDNKIKFRGGFFDDKNLPKNVTHFRDELLKVNSRKDLSRCSFDLKITDTEQYYKENYEKEYLETTERLSKDIIRDDEIEDFFNILVFAVNQPNEAELFGIIDETISDCKGLNLQDNSPQRNQFYGQVIHWMTKKQGTYLCFETFETMLKSVIQNVSKLELITYKRHIYEEIQDYGIEFQEKLQKLQAFLESKVKIFFNLVNSQSTVFSMIKLYYILKDFVGYKKDDSFILMRHEFMKSQDVTDRVLHAFESTGNSNLLIIEFSNNAPDVNKFRKFYDILHKNQEKKIIFITTKAFKLPDTGIGSEDFLDNNNELTDLTDTSQDIILEKTIVNFQGESFNMKQLMDINMTQLKHCVDAQLLFKFIKKEEIIIGEKLPQVQNYFVPRQLDGTQLSDGLLSSKSFYRTSKSTINIADVKPDQDILLISDDKRGFVKLCESHKTMNIHWVRKRGFFFIWKKSFGTTISKLREFLMTDYSIFSIENVHKLKNKVVLISAPPGMGKSTVLTKIANDFKKTGTFLWVLTVNLVELSGKIFDLQNDSNIAISEVIMENFFSNNKECNSLEKNLFHSFYEKGQVVLLLDGFDEICPNHINKFIDLLKFLKESKIQKLIVTTRSYGISAELEDKLLTFSHTLNDLQEEDQINTIVEMWSNRAKADNLNVDRTALKLEAKNLIEIFQKKQLFSFLNNPLHLKMLAVTCQNLENITINFSDLAELYEQFFNILFDNVFIQEKNPHLHASKDTKTTSGMIIKMRKQFIKVHKIMALYLLFKEEVGLFLPKKFENLSPYFDKINSGDYDIGIIEKIVGETPIFVHRTFAEYFCALYLAEDAEWENPDLRKFFRNRLPQEFMCRRFLGSIMTRKQSCSLNVAFFQKNQTELIDLIEKMDDRTFHEKFNVPDKFFNWTPLQNAVKFKYLGVVEILLKRAVEHGGLYDSLILIKDSLYISASRNYVEIVKMFIEKNHNLLIKERDIFLQRAAEDDAVGVVEFVFNLQTKIEHAAIVTILHSAAENNACQVVKYLISKQNLAVDVQNSKGETSLQIAVQKKAQDVIEYLISAKANISIRDKNGNSLLHIIAKNPKFEVIKFLAEQEHVEFNVVNNDGETPLHLIVKYGNLDWVKYFIEDKQADFNVMDRNGNTPLHSSASEGHYNIVEYLLDQKKVDINVTNYNGETPLDLLTKYCPVDRLIHFIKVRNAKFQEIDHNGDTLLHKAASKGQIEFVKFLSNRENNHVHVANKVGKTPLHIVAHRGHLNLVKYLIEEKNANFLVKDYTENSPLHYAASAGRYAIVEYFLGLKNVEVNAVNKSGETPLHLLVQACNELDKIKFFFLEKKVDLKARDCMENTILHYAASKGYFDMIVFLSDQENVEVNVVNKNGETPLHKLAQLGILDGMTHLIEEKQAEFIVKDCNGNTPLHLAALNNKLNVVEYCSRLENVNVNVKNKFEETPMHLAAKQNAVDIVEYLDNLLKTKNETTNPENKYGNTPLHVAALNGALRVVHYFLKHENVKFVISYRAERTPLHLAAEKAASEVLNRLNEKQITEIMSVDSNGNTPLHNAANNDALEVVKFLSVQENVELNAINDLGRTPLHEAAKNNFLEIVKYLVVERKANIDIQTKNGCTPLKLANVYWSKDVEKFLGNFIENA